MLYSFNSKLNLLFYEEYFFMLEIHQSTFSMLNLFNAQLFTEVTQVKIFHIIFFI